MSKNRRNHRKQVDFWTCSLRGRDLVRVVWYETGKPDVNRFTDDPVARIYAAEQFILWVCPGLIRDSNAAYDFLWHDAEIEFGPLLEEKGM